MSRHRTPPKQSNSMIQRYTHDDHRSKKNNEKIYAKTLAAFQNNIPTVSLPLVCNPGGIKTSLHDGAKVAT